jgi:hypothetical protein
MNVVLSLFPDTAGDKAVLDRHNTGLFLKNAQKFNLRQQKSIK